MLIHYIQGDILQVIIAGNFKFVSLPQFFLPLNFPCLSTGGLIYLRVFLVILYDIPKHFCIKNTFLSYVTFKSSKKVNFGLLLSSSYD